MLLQSFKKMISLSTFALRMRQPSMCLEKLTSKMQEFRDRKTTHITREIERDNQKVNAWCEILHNKVIGPYFSLEKTITVNT